MTKAAFHAWVIHPATTRVLDRLIQENTELDDELARVDRLRLLDRHDRPQPPIGEK